jgi:hypothetical protein
MESLLQFCIYRYVSVALETGLFSNTYEGVTYFPNLAYTGCEEQPWARSEIALPFVHEREQTAHPASFLNGSSNGSPKD